MAYPGQTYAAQNFTPEEITEYVRTGAVFLRRSEGLDVSPQDVQRIAAGLIARYDEVRKDDITRRSLTDEIVKEMQALLDAKHMAEIGAVPIAEGKLHPIADEV